MPEYTECKCGNKKRCVIAFCTHCGHTICWYCHLKPVEGKQYVFGSSEPYYTCSKHPDYDVGERPGWNLAYTTSYNESGARYGGNVWYHPDLIKEVAQDEA